MRFWVGLVFASYGGLVSLVFGSSKTLVEFQAAYTIVSPQKTMVRRDLMVPSFDKVSLAGTLQVPKKMQVMFIPLHGSFVQTRDGDLDGSNRNFFPEGAPKRKLFINMATHLYKLHVGSFRYDKRASGLSGGVYEDTDLEVLAKDAKAAFERMKKSYPDTPIGWVGQSEGCLVIFTALMMGIVPDFIVLQGPPLVPFSEIFEFQRTRAASRFMEDKTGLFERKMPYVTAFYRAVYEGDLIDKIENTNDEYYVLKTKDWSMKTSLKKYRQYRVNGFEVLKSVPVKTFILMGEEDQNVPVDPAKKIIEEQRAQTGAFAKVEVQILKGLEHSFREISPGDSWIDVMAKPISRDYLSAIKRYFKRKRYCADDLSEKR